MSTLLEERPMTRDPEVTVRLVTEEARRGGSGGGGGRRVNAGTMLHTAGLGAIAVAILLVVGAITGLFHLGDVFGTNTTTTSTRVLLKELKNLSSYNAGEGTYQVDVTQHDDVAIVPDFIAGGTVTFRAVGTVPATVDFSVLATDAVQRSADDKVTITLPEPTLGAAVVDPQHSRVIGQSRGLVDRIAGIFKGTPTSEGELYIKSAAKIERAARQSKLVNRAKENTIHMLEGFLARLGFTNVTVTFASHAAPAPAAATS